LPNPLAAATIPVTNTAKVVGAQRPITIGHHARRAGATFTVRSLPPRDR
jgi:hypothetical protein